MKIFLIYTIFLVFGNLTAQGQQYTPDFANYLYNTGSYSLAAFEYERLVFQHTDSDSYKLRLITSYRKSGEYQLAEKKVTQLYPNANQMPEKIAFQYGLLLFYQNKIDSLKWYAMQAKLNDDSKLILTSISYLSQQQYQLAYGLLIDAKAKEQMSLEQIRAIAFSAVNTNYKNPNLSMGLSAIIPGAGLCYSGKITEGIANFTAFMFSGALAYHNFNTNGSSFYSWFYLSTSSVLYLNNLFSSHKAAIDYNTRKHQEITERVKKTINSLE